VNYLDFASKISFYEFLQEEFYNPHFNVNNYNDEIKVLKDNLTIDKLTKLLESYPRIIDIFEEVFQLRRFTNSQYIHFCFDVNTLNNSSDERILEHIDNSILKFENGSTNNDFIKLFEKYFSFINNKQEKIFAVKRAITEYIKKFSEIRKRDVLYNHIRNSIGSRYRLAIYLIENLKADEYFASLNLEKFLEIKRHPKDTKGIHGNFGTIKISKILDENNIKNVQDSVLEKTLDANLKSVSSECSRKFCYVKEKKIKGIIKRKDKKLKVFDFVIFYEGTPFILIETNFYTTSGTKIGINQGEYTDLKEDIEKFNDKNDTNLKFIWITDGNYWLTKDGENRFNNLKNNYFENEYDILNYNLLKMKLPYILKD